MVLDIKPSIFTFILILTLFRDLQTCFLKIIFLDFYNHKFYIDYYYFCQQYKDYFSTTKLPKQNISFLEIFFFMQILAFIILNIIISIKAQMQSFGLLLIVFRVSLEETN